MIPGTIHEGIIPSYNFSIDKNAYTSAITSSNITTTTDTTKSAASAANATSAAASSSSSNMIFEYQNTLLSKRSLDEAFGTDLDSSSSENPGVYSSFLMSSSSSSSSSSESDIITPPNSTLRKPGKRQCTKSRSDPPVRPSIIVIDSTKEPLTPGKSPPFSKNGSNNNNTVTKKQHKSESARSNSNLSIDEIVDSLRRRKLNSEVDKKPPYSYAVLICLAILQSPEGKLTLSQIYNWISTHFPFYKPRDASWQNSIRHNLSLNEAFVKTQKSLDGKGHFWEVKESSAPKFFKGEEGGYEGIRRKLRSLEGYFHSVTAMAVTTSTTTTTTTTDPGTETLVSTTTTNLDNSLDNAVPIFSSKNSNSNSDPKSKSKSQSKSKEDRTIDSGKLEGTVSSVERRGSDKYPIEISSLGFSTEPHLDPPRRFRFTGQQFANSLSPIRVPPTASGLNLSLSPILPPPPPSSSSSSQPQVSTSSSLTSFSMFGSNQTLLRSPQNTYKRNNGSLSPGFGELSPFSVRTDTNILLPPPQPSTAFSPTSSILNGGNSNSNGNSSLYNPSGANKLPLLIPPSQQQQQQQQQQFDPLKTPELLMNHTFDRSPCRFVISPAENDTVSRRWQQTPSHLFEDIYTSPIFRAMGRSSKVIATPNGSTVIKRSSPVRQNGGKGLETPLRSKLSCSGLFGVDVVSVWKRAIQTVGKDNDKDKDKGKDKPEKKGHTEEDKENSKDRGENSTNKKSSTPSEGSKPSGKTGDKGQFELKLDVPFQVRHHST